MSTATLSHPLANALTAGFRTAIERIPENADVLADREDQMRLALAPADGFQTWLVDDIALSQIRIERANRMERRQRDVAALRAEFFWDDDRRLLAEELGEKISSKPEKTVAKLRATPQGCDWLLQRWEWLQAALDAGKTWNEAQTRMVLDLLGTPPDFRDAGAARLGDPARLVRAEVADLERQKVEVAESDAFERTMAMADLADPQTPEFRQLRRDEARLHRRIKWSLSLLELLRQPADKPQPEPAPAQRSVQNMAAAAKPEKTAGFGFTPLRPVGLGDEAAGPIVVAPAPAPARRPDPAKLRARARKAARNRRDR